MTRDQWIDDFWAHLWAFRGLAGRGTLMVTSQGHNFGAYSVDFAAARVDDDSVTVIVMEKDIVAAQAVDGTSFNASLSDDPAAIASQVSAWLSERV